MTHAKNLRHISIALRMHNSGEQILDGEELYQLACLESDTAAFADKSDPEYGKAVSVLEKEVEQFRNPPNNLPERRAG